jgi:hypothetical protein
MKRRFLSFSVILVLMTVAARSAAPAISIEEAVATAQRSLKERGFDGRYYLAGVTLERETFGGGTMHWFARWSAAIPRPNRKKEIGLQIKMNGEVIHIVKAPPESPQTRSNRASILDLRGH